LLEDRLLVGLEGNVALLGEGFAGQPVGLDEALVGVEFQTSGSPASNRARDEGNDRS
jgi:hypothetical protein